MNNIEKAVDKILDAGLILAVRDDSKGDYVGDNHMTIIGGVRRVELYTNGTIYANKVKDKFKMINIKGMQFNQAIERAIKIAKKGRC